MPQDIDNMTPTERMKAAKKKFEAIATEQALLDERIASKRKGKITTKREKPVSANRVEPDPVYSAMTAPDPLYDDLGEVAPVYLKKPSKIQPTNVKGRPDSTYATMVSPAKEENPYEIIPQLTVAEQEKIRQFQAGRANQEIEGLLREIEGIVGTTVVPSSKSNPIKATPPTSPKQQKPNWLVQQWKKFKKFIGIDSKLNDKSPPPTQPAARRMSDAERRASDATKAEKEQRDLEAKLEALRAQPAVGEQNRRPLEPTYSSGPIAAVSPNQDIYATASSNTSRDIESTYHTVGNPEATIYAELDLKPPVTKRKTREATLYVEIDHKKTKALGEAMNGGRSRAGTRRTRHDKPETEQKPPKPTKTRY